MFQTNDDDKTKIRHWTQKHISYGWYPAKRTLPAPCLRMADRALLAGYTRYMVCIVSIWVKIYYIIMGLHCIIEHPLYITPPPPPPNTLPVPVWEVTGNHSDWCLHQILPWGHITIPKWSLYKPLLFCINFYFQRTAQFRYYSPGHRKFLKWIWNIRTDLKLSNL